MTSGGTFAGDVRRLDGVAGANVYLVAGDEPFLVDTGMPGQADAILGALAGLGVRAGSLKAIVLTHLDVDHVGSAAALREATGTPVLTGSEEAPFIEGKLSPPGLRRAIAAVVRPFFGPLRPVTVDGLLNEGDALAGGFRVIDTPGHTPGHISLHRPGLFLAGDLVTTQGGRVRPSPSVLTWSRTALAASIAKAAALEVEAVLAGHGPPIENGGKGMLTALARSLGA